MNLEEGDLVLCTVEKIERTVVFVKIEGDGEGSIIMSEIAPGRIRNVRNYVVLRKKIICKVLRISQSGNVELSLRRVTPKEKKEITEQYKQEKSYVNIIKSVLGKQADKAIKEISKDERIFEFFEEIKENPKKLDKIFEKKDSKKILEILSLQKQKTAVIKKEINLRSFNSDGLEEIKNILNDVKNAEIKYISAGKYSIKIESENLKKADKILKEIANEVEKRAKKLGAEFSIIEK
jgi:translation initiation factor 2 alpha subunit (eIF-2alpha)|tara:strand:+ start:2491 stop:3198 length:708 start_codon:yes stop_codon:yes gene_type:complete